MTHCLIGKILDNSGKCKVITCHMDGYLEGAGEILSENYKEPELVDKLLNLGNLSFLGEVPEDDPQLWKDIKSSNKCRTYKGRGDKGEEALFFNSPTEAMKEIGQIYNYFFIDDKWYCKIILLLKNKYRIIELDTGNLIEEGTYNEKGT